MTETYSVRKIPVIHKEKIEDFAADNIDEIKILEISNFIDEWEKELLFSENGFYSLIGKKVENKTKEFIDELEQLVSEKIFEETFTSSASKEVVNTIKNKKIDAIKNQMQMYEQIQLKKWEIEVYENSIKSCIQRAVLYKNNPQIIDSSFQNALSILSVICEKEKWSQKTYEARKESFESDFYLELVKSFISNKDVKAAYYYEKYKEKFKEKDREKINYAVKTLKNSITAYNWAKELFSYELTDVENEKEIKQVKDKEIEDLIRKYLAEFVEKKKILDKEQDKDKNEKNWKEIISILEKEPDRAELYIDYTLNRESINSKKNYIKNIRGNGYIETDKNVFVNLIKIMFENYEKFKKKDISNLRKNLSFDDYKLVEKLRSLSETEYIFMLSDYKYIQSKLFSKETVNDDEIYEIFKMTLAAKNTYVAIKKEEPDIEKRNKLVEAVIERYLDKK